MLALLHPHTCAHRHTQMGDCIQVGQHKFTGDAPTGEANSLASKYCGKPQSGLQLVIQQQLAKFSEEFHRL